MTTVETNADGERVAYVRIDPREYKRLTDALKNIADFPCNCAPDKQTGDDCESCVARAALADAKGEA